MPSSVINGLVARAEGSVEPERDPSLRRISTFSCRLAFRVRRIATPLHVANGRRQRFEYMKKRLEDKFEAEGNSESL